MLIECFCSVIFSLGGKKFQDYISSFYLIFFLFMLNPKNFRFLEGLKESVGPGGVVLVSLNIFYIPLSH